VTRTSPLPCIVCGSTLEPVFSAADASGVASPYQPADAVAFSAYGQYGSTVFDPQDESQLQINVCDKCLQERKDRVWHVCWVRRPAVESFSKQWEPSEG
jgi:hypothetical protein